MLPCPGAIELSQVWRVLPSPLERKVGWEKVNKIVLYLSTIEKKISIVLNSIVLNPMVTKPPGRSGHMNPRYYPIKHILILLVVCLTQK